MARVTVEDCVLSVPNRFELCLIASKRAKNILSGSHSDLSESGEKSTVIALREIGENLVDIQAIKDDIVSSIKNRDGGIASSQDAETSSDEIIESINQEDFVAPVEKNSNNFVSENLEVED